MVGAPFVAKRHDAIIDSFNLKDAAQPVPVITDPLAMSDLYEGIVDLNVDMAGSDVELAARPRKPFYTLKCQLFT